MKRIVCTAIAITSMVGSTGAFALVNSVCNGKTAMGVPIDGISSDDTRGIIGGGGMINGCQSNYGKTKKCQIISHSGQCVMSCWIQDDKTGALPDPGTQQTINVASCHGDCTNAVNYQECIYNQQRDGMTAAQAAKACSSLNVCR